MASKGPDLRHYSYQEVIGSGSFGSICIYKLKSALKESAKYPMRMAVKKVHLEPGWMGMRESEMCSLTHKNIVAFFGVETIDGTVHIKMEIAKCNLKTFQLQSHCGAFKGNDFLHLALQISEGLEYLHKLNYAHRDIKPHNVLVFWHGNTLNPSVGSVNVKLCDFGLSRGVPEGSTTMTTVGTLEYVAPEVRKAFHQNTSFRGDYKKADIFSCGILFLELLLNELPEGSSNEQISFKEHLSSIKEEYVPLLSFMLSVEIRDRISAQSVVAMIRPWYYYEVTLQLQLKKLHGKCDVQQLTMSDQVAHLRNENQRQLRISEARVSQLRTEIAELQNEIIVMQRMRQMKVDIIIASALAVMSVSKEQLRKLMEVIYRSVSAILTLSWEQLQMLIEAFAIVIKRSPEMISLLAKVNMEGYVPWLNYLLISYLAFMKDRFLFRMEYLVEMDAAERSAFDGNLEKMKELISSTRTDIKRKTSRLVKFALIGGHLPVVRYFFDEWDADNFFYESRHFYRECEFRSRIPNNDNHFYLDRTPLIYACQHEHMSVAQYLFDKEISLEGVEGYGATALHMACYAGNFRMVELLLRNGVYKQAKNLPSYEQLRLWERAERINIKNKNGATALHVACSRNHFRIAQLLLEHCADKKMRNRFGLMPLEKVEIRKKEFIELFERF